MAGQSEGASEALTVACGSTGSGETFDVTVADRVAVSAGYHLENRVSTGFVRGFDLATGEQRWEVLRDFGERSSFVSSLASRGGRIVGCGGTSPGRLVVFSDVLGVDAKTGAVSWAVSGLPEDEEGGCVQALIRGKSVVFASDGMAPLLAAVGTR